MKPLFLISKTDENIISRCNERAKMHQRALGLFVLLTAMFAFVSGYYALTMIFGDWDEFSQSYKLSYKKIIIVAVCSLLYALMIGAIDREIISAKNKAAALLRIPLAFIIGIIISIPIKIKILEDRIDQQIRDEQISQMLPYKYEKDNFLSRMDSTISNLEMQISYYTNLKMDEQKRMEAEDIGLFGEGFSGIAGQGIRFSYAKRNSNNYSQIIDELKAAVKEKERYKEERLGQMNNDFKMYKPEAVYGLWSKYEAMHRVVKNDETSQSKKMVIGITLLFILLELIPSIIKLITPKNEYDMISEYMDELIKLKLCRALEEAAIETNLSEYIQIPEIKVAS
jgi:hypothetical protein